MTRTIKKVVVQLQDLESRLNRFRSRWLEDSITLCLGSSILYVIASPAVVSVSFHRFWDLSYNDISTLRSP